MTTEQYLNIEVETEDRIKAGQSEGKLTSLFFAIARMYGIIEAGLYLRSMIAKFGNEYPNHI